MKVIVSNFVKQHTHLLCQSLLNENRLDRVFTSFGIEGKIEILKRDFLIIKIIKKIKNKRIFNIPQKYIDSIPIIEFIKQSISIIGIKQGLCMSLFFEKFYDRVVALKLIKLDFDVFIGSEKSSLKSFKFCRKKEKITILDLAAVHFNKNRELIENYDQYRSVISSKKCFEKLNLHKTKELSYVDYIFCLSNYAKESLLRAGISRDKIYVHYLPINQELFSPKNEKLNTSDVIKVLFVGRVSRLKGIELIMKASNYFALNGIKTFQFTVIGPKDNSFDVSVFSDNNIEYKEFLPHWDLVKEYQNHDVFLSPSYTDSWGQTVIESMGCGTPVIISENMGAKDAVLKGGGFVIPVNNYEAIVEKLLFFNNNRDQLLHMGKGAYEISKEYSFTNYSKSVNNSINEIVEIKNQALC